MIKKSLTYHAKRKFACYSIGSESWNETDYREHFGKVHYPDSVLICDFYFISEDLFLNEDKMKEYFFGKEEKGYLDIKLEILRFVNKTEAEKLGVWDAFWEVKFTYETEMNNRMRPNLSKELRRMHTHKLFMEFPTPDVVLLELEDDHEISSGQF